ncbi:uncharacterized protein LOC130740345 [Lotus japonicus]|uniref:uncharacterized protein LOC130740345 n=1 Tax=Lotus japonicus TaxID=34305 RepID=UPI00258BD4C1|nr:uncharacterized protein LOC130740345 [Lotus japonicus]
MVLKKYIADRPTPSAWCDFDKVEQISLDDHPWNTKVRVLACWKNPDELLESESSCLEMVLIGAEGVKIQASICKRHPIRNQIAEGAVYKISNFRIFPNDGVLRFTGHSCRLFFHGCTKMVRTTEDGVIPLNCWSFFDTRHIKIIRDTFTEVIDFVGLVIAASEEKVYIRNSKITKRMVIQLQDLRGNIHCVLEGEHVETFLEYLSSNWTEKPMMVIQFVKVFTHRGRPFIDCIPPATKMYIEPVIEESVVLAGRLAEAGFQNGPVEFISRDIAYANLNADVLKFYPRRTISELLVEKEQGVFLVHVVVVAVLKGGYWCYPSCRCHNELNLRNDAFECSKCSMIFEKMIHRYRVKIEVFDASDSAVFVLFEREVQQLISVSCEDLVSNIKVDDDSNVVYPQEFEDRIPGKELIFKIRNDGGITYNGAECYHVLAITEDPEAISLFHALQSNDSTANAQFGTNTTGVENNEELEDKEVGGFSYNTPFEDVPESSTGSLLPKPLKRKLVLDFDDESEEDGNNVQVVEGFLNEKNSSNLVLSADEDNIRVEVDEDKSIDDADDDFECTMMEIAEEDELDDEAELEDDLAYVD